MVACQHSDYTYHVEKAVSLMTKKMRQFSPSGDTKQIMVGAHSVTIGFRSKGGAPTTC